MPDEVVSRVEQLGRKDGQPNLLVFTNKHDENLLDGELENLDDDDLSYATEVGSDEIPGVDSDLSAMSDVPDEDLLNPNVEVQQNTGGLQEDSEMETIQEEDEGQESVMMSSKVKRQQDQENFPLRSQHPALVILKV